MEMNTNHGLQNNQNCIS